MTIKETVAAVALSGIAAVSASLATRSAVSTATVVHVRSDAACPVAETRYLKLPTMPRCRVESGRDFAACGDNPAGVIVMHVGSDAITATDCAKAPR